MSQQIWIMDQSTVTKLCGLEELPHLRILNVTQCNVEKIEGLENLVCLEKLFLFNNKIKAIENIEHLTSLEVHAQRCVRVELAIMSDLTWPLIQPEIFDKVYWCKKTCASVSCVTILILDTAMQVLHSWGAVCWCSWYNPHIIHALGLHPVSFFRRPSEQA